MYAAGDALRRHAAHCREQTAAQIRSRNREADNDEPGSRILFKMLLN